VKRFDVVAFHTPPLAAVRCGAGGVFIKRVIGMPGDRWAERAGYVYVNGRKLAEPYIPSVVRDTRTVAPIPIPLGTYFLLGDNRSSSCDSRTWGSVPKANLIGKVVRIIRAG
jgi:signal peptidase I